jgi:hypothetical protein
VAGPSGGYLLARPPEEISLLAVIRAVDDDPASRVCVLRGGPCRWDDSCAVHTCGSRRSRRCWPRLDQATLAEVIEVDAAIDAGGQAGRCPSPLLDGGDRRTSSLSGSVPGRKRATTSPSGATRNFSKFHCMSPASPSASGCRELVEERDGAPGR